MADFVPQPIGYTDLLTRLQQRIRQAQLEAALAVNARLVVLYWHIGREILHQQQQQGWGAKVVEQLARDLSRAFPEMKGLSRRNLDYMRAFAATWTDETICATVVAQIALGALVLGNQSSERPR